MRWGKYPAEPRHPCTSAEVMDIAFAWPDLLAAAAPKITVPVHYRQADGDALWIVSEKEVSDFAQGLSASLMVVAGPPRRPLH